MTVFRVATIVLIGSALAWVPAISIASERAMPNAYYDTVGAKLMNVGYRDIRVVDPDSGKVVAYDEQGSEVVLTIHPSNRQIVDTIYVHPADN